jgi:hypothetical protein
MSGSVAHNRDYVAKQSHGASRKNCSAVSRPVSHHRPVRDHKQITGCLKVAICSYFYAPEWTRTTTGKTPHKALQPHSPMPYMSARVQMSARTLCYAAYVSVNVSVRLDDALAERLRLRARTAGETLSDRLRRYAEEGARRDEHPLVTFRDGPAGRRAGLLGGPDVWEVVMWLEDLAAEGDPIAALVEDSILTRSQVDAALRYSAAYPDEIAARIELHRRETAAAETP